MAYQKRLRQHARRGLEQLFRTLKRWASPPGKGIIEVVYPQWFPKGECIIGVKISLKDQPLLLIMVVALRHLFRNYRFPPVIVNAKNGVYLTLTWRFPGITLEQRGLLLQNARAIEQWAEKLFETSAIVMPSKGLLDARRRLHAYA